jgi:hypothetical protein
MTTMRDRVRVGRSPLAPVLVAALLAGPGIVPGIGLAASGGQCAGVESLPGGWTAGPTPATATLPVGEPPTSLVATTIVGQDPLVALATDGVSVFRTTDRGCNWQPVFTVGAIDYYSANSLATGYSVTNIATGHDVRPANQQDVYLALSPNPLNAFSMVTLFGAAPPELLAASHDGGRTFNVVAPQPSVANPIVPECLSAPALFIVPPTDAKRLYLQCNGGLAQSAAEQEVAGGVSVAFRSSDGGVSWSVIGLPAVVRYPTDPHWIVPGVQKDELWLGGYWSSTTAPVHTYIAIWHSRDGGDTWTRLLPEPTPLPDAAGQTSVGVAVDTAPGPGMGRVVVYTHTGTYATADLGKHWQRLRAVKFPNGVRVPIAAFFLRHSLHELFGGVITCKADPVFVRYPTVGARPVTLSYPAKWGKYAGWAADESFAVVSKGVIGSGLATFCVGNSETPTVTKLLSLRVG